MKPSSFIYIFFFLTVALGILLLIGRTGRLELVATCAFAFLLIGILFYGIKSSSNESPQVKKVKKNSFKKIAIYLFLTISAFWGFWLQFPHSASDSPYPYRSAFDLRSVRPAQVWRAAGSDGLGYYTLDTQWSWASDFLVYYLVKNFHIEYWMIAQTLFVFGGLLVSYVGTSRLQNRFGIGYWPSLAGSIFYALNSYIILLIDGGQLSLALAYSFLPICFYLFVSLVDRISSLKLLQFIVASLALSIFDIRFIYLLILLILVYFLFFPRLKQFIQIGAVTGIIFVGFHFYWLIPTFFSSQSGLPSTYIEQSQLELLNFSSLTHSLFFSQPHWFKNVFGQISLPNALFIFIPILVFSVPLFTKKPSRQIVFWLVTALIFVYLAKGYSPPLRQFYSWMFISLPGFFLFRDSTKFMAIQALAYSILLGLSANYLYSKNKKILTLIIIYLLISVYPLYTGRLNGMLARHPQENSYLSFAKTVESDGQFGRIVWLPSISPLGVTNNLHPAIDALALATKRPFATGSIGRYESTNFIRDNQYMEELFNVAAVQYLVIPPPVDKPSVQATESQIKYFDTLIYQFSKLDWLEKDSRFDIPVFKTKKIQDHLFVTYDTEYVLGSMEDYFQTKKELAKTAVVFLEDQTDSLRYIEVNPGKIVLQDKIATDLVASLIPSEHFIFPSATLSTSPVSARSWWKRESSDYVWLRDFLEQKHTITTSDLDFGGGWAISEGDTQYSLTLPSCASTCELFIRAMHSPKSESIEIIQDETSKISITTFDDNPELQTRVIAGDSQVPAKKFTYPKAQFRWHRIGVTEPGATITILPKGKINIINAFIFVPSDKWRELNNRALDLLNITASQNPTPPATIIHTRESPSRYIVQVSDLRRPFTLAFSENYNPLWQANGKKSIPLYGFINGFFIDSPGKYIITIANQDKVNKGMVVTSVFILILIVWWMKASSSDKIKQYERKDS